ncbi:MAG: glycosyltransferase family 1 protein [Homoserinimonas sp.]
MIRARLVQLRRVLATEGLPGLRRRLIRVGHRMLGEQQEPLPLNPGDVSDSATLAAPQPVTVAPGPLRVGWITTPPGAGSGGHTTMLRMIEGLEKAGHATSLYLYDIFRGDLGQHERVIRAHWPGVTASVHDVRDGLGDADVWIATSWQTAHVLASRPEATGRRMYFVQDYEPYFYPRGALYALAEDTYRFGFTGITAGAWLAEELTARFGMRCGHFEFGADTGVYTVTSPGERNGVVFYTKPGVARRGHEIGMLALEVFASDHPDADIHLFGDPPGATPFAAHSHGRVTPTELNGIYNLCRVGLSLSFTNVSLIPWELLASGATPVVNDAPHNRMVLRNPHVAWATAGPAAIADALSAAWDAFTPGTTPRLLSASIAGDNWDDAASTVTEFIERTARHDAFHR